ncbi:hypothetical protein CEG15_15210 [Vibrio anguillarum]|nr:hypothetical protein CEG15_15210 [Vibrio anguillarum]
MSWLSILIFIVVFGMSYWFFNRPKSSVKASLNESQEEYEDLDEAFIDSGIDYSPTYLSIDYLIGKEVTVKWLDNQSYQTNELEMVLLNAAPDNYLKCKCLETNKKYTINDEDLTHDGLKFEGNPVVFVDNILDILPDHSDKITKNMLDLFLNQKVCFNYLNHQDETHFHTISVSDVDNDTGSISGYFLKNGKPEDTKYTFLVENMTFGIFKLDTQYLFEFVSNDEIPLYT